ncbi:bifunctional DNA primase/polymerase [Neorhizobium galegae]|uniref:bifunctional DNA primase/polymerase n=1 Tax=Neorhizobium galegae TaxID=399 RepID=UPI000621DE0F|nr:bifunctional DNA primase/polymerase [Neorhizobium galegae]KAB1126315.1 hypothetical protein F4V90_04155 [Neorhizobium galegae]MCQ1805286.1 bifunctional DNA primase/polymerase [Neorhizobium galegae]CDZ56048.1 Primase [Neorhizobium galegae bv. orientalis]
MSNTSAPLPTPGKITTVAGVPLELRNIQQWVLWKPLQRHGKVTKRPCILGGVEIAYNDPAYWRTFDAVVADMQSDEHGHYGIGLVLANSGLVCIDYDDHPSDDRAAVAAGAEAVAELLRDRPTYMETSVSGKGKHVFYTGVLPHELTGGIIAPMSLEIYSASFIAITGNTVWGAPSSVADGQALIDSWNLPKPVRGAGSLGPSVSIGQRLDLDDDEVAYTLQVRRPHQFATLISSAPLGSGNRGRTYSQIIGDLDKITGDPVQIDRMMRQSPMLKNAHNLEKYDRQGERWLERKGCANLFEYWLKGARASNDRCLPHVEKLTTERRAQMEELFDAISRATAERNAPLAPEALADQEIPENELFRIVADLSCGLPSDVRGNDAIEHLIDCNMRGSKKPFRLFSEVATVGAFGALFARKFKASDGTSTMAMEMLVAKTGSGKGEAFSYWVSHISKRATPSSPPKAVGGPASSAEALHGLIQRTGSTLWVRADADADVQMLAKPADSNQKRFRNYVYEVFDASRHGQAAMQPPESIAAQKRGDRAIDNACCSLLWSTTPAAFAEVYDIKVLSTGLGSRAIITVHDTRSGDFVHDSQVVKDPDARASNILNQATLHADAIDEAYIRGTLEGDSHIQVIGYADDAAALLWELEKKQSEIQGKIDDDEYPSHYAVFARTSALTKKHALLSALVRFFDLPQSAGARPIISRQDVEWGLSRVVRSMRTLAKMFDEGKLGKGSDAARRAVFKGWVLAFVDPKTPPRDKRISQEMLDSRLIPHWWLTQRSNHAKVFAEHPYGADHALRATIAGLMADGVMSDVSTPKGGKRYQVIDVELL